MRECPCPFALICLHFLSRLWRSGSQIACSSVLSRLRPSRDGDGDVDGDEFKSGLSQLVPVLSQDVLEAVYREVDADGDGNVDYGEFASRMFQKPGMKRPTAPKRGRPGERQKRRGRAFKPGVAEALDPISAHLEQLKKFSYVSKKKRKDGERTDGRTVADSEAIKLSEEELLARQVDNIFRVIRQQMEGARTLYGKKLKGKSRGPLSSFVTERFHLASAFV
eukprot:COSAG06_NODE_3947_length_4738_cov_2.160379_3_plen_222_part_00